MEYFAQTGVSDEGHSYTNLLEYPDGAPQGAQPVRMICIYKADDGSGVVGIERTPEGLYKRRDEPETFRFPSELLPGVVADGVDDRGMKAVDAEYFESYWVTCEKST